MITKILCIDDDLIALMLYKKVISKISSTIKIDTAKNGKDAIDYFSSLNINDMPQFVFLDLNMPVLDGWDFLKIYLEKFFTKFPNIKFIVLSSTIDPKEVEKSKAFPNVVDFISKPLTTTMVEELINSSC